MPNTVVYQWMLEKVENEKMDITYKKTTIFKFLIRLSNKIANSFFKKTKIAAQFNINAC